MKCLQTQVRVIAFVEAVISLSLLTLNVKILMEITSGSHKDENLGDSNNSRQNSNSVSAVTLFFLIRVIYLFGEFILAINLNFWVHKENVSGLILWFTLTIIFSIASRCYFIGGIIWRDFFSIALAIFCGNLAFTIYSLVVIYLFLKHLIGVQHNEMNNSRGLIPSSSSTLSPFYYHHDLS